MINNISSIPKDNSTQILIKKIFDIKENEKDILEIKPIYLKGLTFHYVEDICQVTDFALLEEKCEK